jgi:polyhydroxybutyrate depolymerase
VLDLHGSSSNGVAQMDGDGIRALADRERFAVVAPDGAIPFSPAPGYSGYTWNIPGVPLVGTATYPPAGTRDDVQFLAHVIDAVSDLACIDSARVYATGVSGGGRMASQLACDLPDRIAAIAPISGVRFPKASDNPPTTVQCAPGRAVPVIAIHGVWDPVNPFAATPPPEAATLPAAINPPVPGSSWSFSAEEAVQRWAANNRCKGQPRVRAETPNIDVVSYRGCHAGADVVLYEVKNGGHASPGHGNPALDSLLNPTNTEVDGTVVAWEFLRSYRLK